MLEYKGKKLYGVHALRASFDLVKSASERSLKSLEPLLMYHWHLEQQQQEEVKTWAAAVEISQASASSSSAAPPPSAAVPGKAKSAKAAKKKEMSDKAVMSFFS